MFVNTPFAAILFACATLGCTAPSEIPAKNVPARSDRLIAANPVTPDTVGLCAAYLRFAKQNGCPTCPTPRELPAACWNLLTMAGDSSGMIPVSSNFDESAGFKALFFKRRNGRFLFYCAEEHHSRFFSNSLETDGVASSASGK